MTNFDDVGQSDQPEPLHPLCATCGVPMWLVKIEAMAAGNCLHFECKACDGQARLEQPQKTGRKQRAR